MSETTLADELIAFADNNPNAHHAEEYGVITMATCREVAALRDRLYTAEAALADARRERDALRDSLASEIREALRVRGLWAPLKASDLIGAVGSAIDTLTQRLAAARRGRDKFASDALGYALECGKAEGRADAAEREREAMRAAAEKAEADAAGVVNVLGFFASCIKCGDPWTDECDKMLRAAFTHRETLTRATAPTTEDA